ncbi:cobalamin-binding protein [Candidatus Thorarchaeota archaeon]|nr:MAG: cobalamin-binding protein [Candidatus Thorarchaeota archaeon]
MIQLVFSRLLFNIVDDGDYLSMNDLTTAMADIEDEQVIDLIKKHLSEGREPVHILGDLKEGMDIVGQRFSDNEYFLVELVMSAEVFKRAMEILEPKLLPTKKEGGTGKIVIGTVEGDVHYIGKNLVIAFLLSNGFEVYDLGEDVPPEKFIEKLKETGAKVLALSGLITITHDVMKRTIEALVEAGIRDDVKVVIGGGDIDQSIVEYTGADAFGKDAMSSVEIAKKFIEELS